MRSTSAGTDLMGYAGYKVATIRVRLVRMWEVGIQTVVCGRV